METINTNWKKCSPEIFWEEVSCDHIIQVYKTDEAFRDTLESFALCGIRSGNCVVLMGTPEHLNFIKRSLRSNGLNIAALADDDQLILLDAELTLAKLMENGVPVEKQFTKVFNKVLLRARNRNRKIRMFGEMVAIISDQGYAEGTIKMEYLWSKFCKNEKLCHFCAYPHSSFENYKASTSITTICHTHTKRIAEINKLKNEIFYWSISE